MALFKRRKKRKQIEYEKEIAENNVYEDLSNSVTTKTRVVDMCEQLIEVSKEFEDSKEEYDLVTNYLKDIEIIENLDSNSRSALADVAANVARLSKARNEFLKTEKKLSDSQFAQMQEFERELPTTINRLVENENDLDIIRKDLRYLEGEKTELEIIKDECLNEQKQLRKLAIAILILFALTSILLIVGSFFMSMHTQVPMLIVATISAAVGAYVFLKYQEMAKEIQKVDVNRNYAITLENRVKIKYVNMKNAVDYICEKYHVKNSYELNYNYEQYLEAVKRREKFKITNEDLEYYNRELMFILNRYNMYDPRVWLNHANAIVDKKELVELKHDLIVRRQKLRSRMEYNLNIIAKLRGDILLHRNELGDRVEQVNRILRKVAEMNMQLTP